MNLTKYSSLLTCKSVKPQLSLTRHFYTSLNVPKAASTSVTSDGPSPGVCPLNSASGPLKPFKSMPGPRPLPFIWNIWRYFPLIGQYSLSQMEANGRLNLAKYGSIVREEITSNHRIVHLFNPKDMESMFTQEGRYPCRRSHRALIKYRSERPDTYASGGIFPENGAEWARLRDLFKRSFLVPKSVNAYDRVIDTVSGDLLELIRRTQSRESGEMTNFQETLYRWALESICAILLDTRIGCLGLNLAEQSDASRLIAAAHQTIYAVMRTELYPGWEDGRGNGDYRQLEHGQDVMAEIVGKHLRARIAELKTDQSQDKSQDTLLRQFIRNPDISEKDLFAMILDCVLAGIDTTSVTASFALYFLARHPEYQEKLREEVRQMTGGDKGRVIRADDLASMPWLKAIIKETLRLRPVAIGVGRLTKGPMELSGYEVPAETMIITQNQVACQLEEYFPQADAFKPERWINERKDGGPIGRKAGGERNSAQSAANRFLWLPFGHGTRMCIGRRFAELEMYILLCKIVGNFKVTYEGEDVGIETVLINLPDKPMNFKFTDI